MREVTITEETRNKMKENIKQYEIYYKEIERLNNIIKEAKEFIYENAYDSERQNCIDDLWGEIPKLLEILDKEKDNEQR